MSSKPWWDEEDDFGRPKLGGSKKGGGSSSNMLTFNHHASCFESHKPMVIGDTGLQIYGGSCSRPIVDDADVYIGFDSGMRFRHTLPWAFKPEILYEISDMHAPKEVTNFRKLVSWTAEQLQSGAKVHCGCIGGPRPHRHVLLGAGQAHDRDRGLDRVCAQALLPQGGRDGRTDPLPAQALRCRRGEGHEAVHRQLQRLPEAGVSQQP